MKTFRKVFPPATLSYIMDVGLRENSLWHSHKDLTDLIVRHDS
jgi:hypothetical protein